MPMGSECGLAMDQRSPASRSYLLVFLEKLGGGASNFGAKYSDFKCYNTKLIIN